MEVINKPQVNQFRKSFQFFISDHRKIWSVVAALLLPVANNFWKLLPKEASVDFYSSLQVFGWTFGIHAMLIILSLAWWFSVHRKDYVLQFFSLGTLFYSIFLTYSTLPFSNQTPLWLNLAATATIFICVWGATLFIKIKYSNYPQDYKVMHDGLIHDLHHQKFLGSVNRIEGLLHLMDNVEDPYHQLCFKEIEKLKSSFVYITEKYEDLA